MRVTSRGRKPHWVVQIYNSSKTPQSGSLHLALYSYAGGDWPREADSDQLSRSEETRTKDVPEDVENRP